MAVLSSLILWTFKFFGVSKIEFVGYMDDEYWNEGKGGVVVLRKAGFMV